MGRCSTGATDFGPPQYMTIYREASGTAGIAFSVSLALLIALCSCSQKHSHIPPPQFLSDQAKVEVVRNLLAAKELDESQAHDPTVGRVTAEDSAVQAAEADKLIKELSHGYEISQADLAEALEVPPRHLSPQRKADLIRQLEDARALDDRAEQELLSDYFSNRPVDTDKFDSQKELITEVIKELEIGDDVHWWTIKQALRVPMRRSFSTSSKNTTN